MGELVRHERLQDFIDHSKESYESNGDNGKLNDFNSAVAYMKSRKVEPLGEGNFFFEDEKFRYEIYICENKSLKVIKKSDTYDYNQGYFREMFSMRQSLLSKKSSRSGHHSELNCSPCGKDHMKYGVELEFNCLNDHTYREVLLRKLNNKIQFDSANDIFGIDGGGRALEIRGINGNTGAEIESALSEKLAKVKECVPFFKKTLPFFKTQMDTVMCGTHIHMFHKNVTRSKLTVAHSFVGLLINSANAGDWKARLSNHYGEPFAVRGNVPWCRTNDATELRVLNAVSPKMVRFAIESTEEILSNDFACSSETLNRYLRDARISYSSVPEKINTVLALFLENKVAKFGQMKRMMSYISKNYDSVVTLIK